MSVEVTKTLPVRLDLGHLACLDANYLEHDRLASYDPF
jgi:hypothetical protein